MDRQLEEKWLSAVAPFDEQCLYLEDYIHLSELRVSMVSIIETLEQTYSTTSIYCLDDWHEHDGFLRLQTNSSFDAINRILVSDESLYAAGHGDDFVRWAYYPEDFSFLFRFYIHEADRALELAYIQGDFDLCASFDLIEQVKQVVPQSIVDQLVTGNAKEFFDQKYVG